jgi:hypothetical protein
MVEDSKKLAQALYDIMNANVTIPSADFAVVTFQVHSMMYLGLLKMNYKESYVHMTQNNEDYNEDQPLQIISITFHNTS